VGVVKRGLQRFSFRQTRCTGSTGRPGATWHVARVSCVTWHVSLVSRVASLLCHVARVSCVTWHVSLVSRVACLLCHVARRVTGHVLCHVPRPRRAPKPTATAKSGGGAESAGGSKAAGGSQATGAAKKATSSAQGGQSEQLARLRKAIQLKHLIEHLKQSHTPHKSVASAPMAPNSGLSPVEEIKKMMDAELALYDSSVVKKMREELAKEKGGQSKKLEQGQQSQGQLLLHSLHSKGAGTGVICPGGGRCQLTVHCSVALFFRGFLFVTGVACCDAGMCVCVCVCVCVCCYSRRLLRCRNMGKRCTVSRDVFCYVFCSRGSYPLRCFFRGFPLFWVILFFPER